MQTSWVHLLHWTLSCLLLSLESGVDCPCPWFHANPLLLASLLSSRQLPLCWLASSTALVRVPRRLPLSCPLPTSGYGEISGPRILCLVSCQNRQRNHLLWQPTHIVLHALSAFLSKLQLYSRNLGRHKFLVFHTSGSISSSSAAFLFSFFLSTESSSSCVNCSSLMFNCLRMIPVIGSYVTFGGFPSNFLKCCFHSSIRFSWLVVFSLAFAVLFLLLTSFTVCHAILDCLSSIESLILLIWFCMYSVCSFRYMLAYFILCLFKFQVIDIGWVLPIAFGGSFHVCMLFSNH